MASDQNLWIATGRIGRDIEKRTTQGGMSISNFSIAVGVDEKIGNEWKSEPFWARCVAFDKQADTIAKHFAQGDEITIHGHWRTNKGTDQQGEPKKNNEVIVHKFFFGRKKGESASQGNSSQPQSGQPAQQRSRDPRHQPQQQSGGWGHPGDDLDSEIPF